MSNLHHLPAAPQNDGAQTVASNVRALLAYHSLTQAQLATALGVSEMHISRRTSGSTEFKASEIVAVALYFKIKPGDLFEHRRGTKVGFEGLGPPTSSVKTRGLATVHQLRPTA